MVLKQGGLLVEDGRVNESVWPFQRGFGGTVKATVVGDLGSFPDFTSKCVTFLFHGTIKGLSLFLNFKTTQRWN